MVVEKNKQNWNDYADSWSKLNHSEQLLRPVLDNPSKAFHKTTWELIRKYLPDLKGKRVCVPSSGDNHAVFAFALLGAAVTSCDISENQLKNAERIAKQEGIYRSIEFVCEDTMKLGGIADGEYDLVYTSNGVHVWLNDLPAMYRNIHRVLKPGGFSILYEVHPIMRPFREDLKVVKPYNHTGPFEDEYTITYEWRLQDILNAAADAGLRLLHIEEMFAEKNYDLPFWVKTEDIIRGMRVSREEVDRMYDWKENPRMALPNWVCAVGQRCPQGIR